jgi:hypothetical protein
LRARGRSGPSGATSAVASDLKHIFLIAGPSGSGKSTFMREFVYDRLPRDISDYLPADAKTWQRTSGNELSRKGLARVRAGRGRTAGLVVHYDIMRPYARRFEHYASAMLCLSVLHHVIRGFGIGVAEQFLRALASRVSKRSARRTKAPGLRSCPSRAQARRPSCGSCSSARAFACARDRRKRSLSPRGPASAVRGGAGKAREPGDVQES